MEDVELDLIAMYGVCPDCGSARTPADTDGEAVTCTVDPGHAVDA